MTENEREEGHLLDRLERLTELYSRERALKKKSECRQPGRQRMRKNQQVRRTAKRVEGNLSPKLDYISKQLAYVIISLSINCPQQKKMAMPTLSNLRARAVSHV